ALALAGGDQAKEDLARGRALCLVELIVGRLGEARDGAVDATGLLVRGHAEPAAAFVLPELDERRRKQWECGRLVGDFLDEGVDQRALDPQPDSSGGQLDRAAKFLL